MSRQFRIEIWGTIPDDNNDLDAEAKVATKEPATAIIKQLETLGLTHCSQKRWTLRSKAAVTKPPPGPDTAAAELPLAE